MEITAEIVLFIVFHTTMIQNICIEPQMKHQNFIVAMISKDVFKLIKWKM